MSRIADPTNAVSAVVGSESLAKEAAPTKLMTASPRLLHVMWSQSSILWMPCPHLRHFLMPRPLSRVCNKVTTTSLSFASFSYCVQVWPSCHSQRCVRQDASHRSAGSRASLEALAQQQLILGLRHRCYYPALHFVLVRSINTLLANLRLVWHAIALRLSSPGISVYPLTRAHASSGVSSSVRLFVLT